MTATLTLQESKRRLRKVMQAKLLSIDSATIHQQSAVVSSKVMALSVYKQAQALSIYLSMPTAEIDTRFLVVDALNRGKRVYVPFIHSIQSGDKSLTRSTMNMVRLSSILDLESMEASRDRWGIPSMMPEARRGRECVLSCPATPNMDHLNYSNGKNASAPKRVATRLDLMLLPGMAFDRNCNRLGHGKGFYDRFLDDYHKAIHDQDSKSAEVVPHLVGLALDEQIISESDIVPVDDSDWRLQRVVAASEDFSYTRQDCQV